MTMRLSPSEYVFAIADLEFSKSELLDRRTHEPKDLFAPDSKWFFVEMVSITSGGGSTRSTPADPSIIRPVGTQLKALWAKAKSDIAPEDRPFKAGDRVFCKNVNDGSWDSTPRTVARVADLALGQYVWLEAWEGSDLQHRLNVAGHAECFIKCELAVIS